MDREEIITRAEKILARNPNRVFEHDSFTDPKRCRLIYKQVMPDEEKFKADQAKIVKMQKNNPDLIPCYQAPILSKEQEQHLFLKMNYCKFQLQKTLHKMQPKLVGEKRVLEAELWNSRYTEIRNTIALSNFRLAIAITKNHTGVYRRMSLMDSLLSDQYANILKAVDYFDYRLGYKFSTYCTWVLRKNHYREVAITSKYYSRFTNSDHSRSDFPDLVSKDSMEEYRAYKEDKAKKNRLVNRLLKVVERRGSGNIQNQLDILRSYYGLSQEQGKTLLDVGKEKGLSKERIRQIKNRALKTIQSYCVEKNITFENAIA